MRIQRAVERIAAPWKNGGGVTWEAAVAPAGASMDDFDWRISIAEVSVGGPFSKFPEVDRVLTVIAGRGLRLQIDGLGVMQLDAGAPPLAFPGDALCTAELLEGPIYDLNVMCRRGIFRPSVRRVSGPVAIARAGEVTAILATGPTSIGGHLLEVGDICFAVAGERIEIAEGDVVVAEVHRA